VQSGEVRFVPENWINTYNQWMNNITDWCISRQLWWGHQIPAWYDEDGKVYVARNEAEAQAQAPGQNPASATKTCLDTWYSSAWCPFSTMGWPQIADRTQRPPELTEAAERWRVGEPDAAIWRAQRV
jgi:valyl-tRNA synthetase